MTPYINEREVCRMSLLKLEQEKKALEKRITKLKKNLEDSTQAIQTKTAALGNPPQVKLPEEKAASTVVQSDQQLAYILPKLPSISMTANYQISSSLRKWLSDENEKKKPTHTQHELVKKAQEVVTVVYKEQTQQEIASLKKKQNTLSMDIGKLESELSNKSETITGLKKEIGKTQECLNTGQALKKTQLDCYIDNILMPNAPDHLRQTVKEHCQVGNKPLTKENVDSAALDATQRYLQAQEFELFRITGSGLVLMTVLGLAIEQGITFNMDNNISIGSNEFLGLGISMGLGIGYSILSSLYDLYKAHQVANVIESGIQHKENVEGRPTQQMTSIN